MGIGSPCIAIFIRTPGTREVTAAHEGTPGNVGMSPTTSSPRLKGGLAAYFVRHREVGWMALVAVLIWGGYAFTQLAQQEDPTIPHRHALVVTQFPGAPAAKVEALVTKLIEKKIAELPSIEEISSQSRQGVSVITVAQQPAPAAWVEQEWDKLRAKLTEVRLPQGCQPPHVNADFGRTLTLVLALTSPAVTDPEHIARANLVRETLATLRQGMSSAGRAAVVAFYPAAVADSYRQALQSAFQTALLSEDIGRDVRLSRGQAFDLADFATDQPRDALDRFLQRFVRRIAGTEGELHPDFGAPLILLGDEDPLPRIREGALPRYSYRQLEIAAEGLEDELKQLPAVGRVVKIGNVQETIYLLLSTAAVSGYRLDANAVLQALAARNALIPGGSLSAGGQSFPVQVTGEFVSERDLLHPVIGLTQPEPGRALAPVYLRDVFEVRRTYENPVPFKVDLLQRPVDSGPLTVHRGVLLGVEMREGRRIGQFAQDVEQVLTAYRTRLPEGMALTKVSDQPAAVRHRLAHFSRCFGEAVLIVILVALGLMNWRSALVVAAAIPLTVAMTLGGMHLMGIPLHQISIAALIIALGMLVDDPVVASDAINRELHHGAAPDVAAWLGPVKLARAILFGTLINIVAFLPLTLLPGDKGAFIYALPMVVTLSLVASRVVSMTFVPMLGYYVLRGQKGLEEGGEIRRFVLFRWVDSGLAWLLPRYERSIRRALERPWRAIGAAYGLLLLSFGLIPFFGTQFFPPAERNQLLIDIELPAGASVSQTRQAADQVVEVLRSEAAIVSAAVFTGGTAPRFYYNVSPKEPSAHLAQVLVNTRSAGDVPPLVDRLRHVLDARIVAARCTVKQLEQGPPLEVPIQIRLSGDDLDRLRQLADRVTLALREAGGYLVHDDLGLRTPCLEIDIDQDQANTLGVSNREVGQVAALAFSGIRVTELREGDHLVPVVMRLRVEERSDADQIRSLYVQSQAGNLLPLDSFARLRATAEYATIPHHGLLRTVTVKAYAPFGELPSAVIARVKPSLDALDLPAGYRLEYAGEAKELRQSQQEMGLVMLVSLGLIALAMVIQFNSVTKSLVVMLTVPLGLIGAFLGITVLQTSLGFMSLLGMVSLAGIIVSHIIVLSDFIEEARQEGVELKQALVQAGLVRLRAVMVTVLATVGGLVPLTLTGGELWRPLTAVHIFGLLLATLLTLIMLPVLYYLFTARLRWIR
jgi:multidrug efflux pump subunit AcrB